MGEEKQLQQISSRHWDIPYSGRSQVGRSIEAYNKKPERPPPKLKYAHSMNEALSVFFQSRK